MKDDLRIQKLMFSVSQKLNSIIDPQKYLYHMFLKAKKSFSAYMSKEKKIKLENREYSYNNYLKGQLDRSLQKSADGTKFLNTEFTVLISDFIQDKNCKVICVGCRSGEEIDVFHQIGLMNIIGIDLMSNRPDVLVMDMHELQFDERSFDVIFSSHSFEHAFYPQKVSKEFIRIGKDGTIIGIEVPVNFETKGADIWDYGSVVGVLSYFEPHIDKVLYGEYIIKENNKRCGTDVVRVIFQLSK